MAAGGALVVESALAGCLSAQPCRLQIGRGAPRPGSASSAASITVGGFCLLADLGSSLPGDRGIAWQLDIAHPSLLQLADVSLASGLLGVSAEVYFPGPVHTSVAFAEYHNKSILAFAVLADGGVCCLQLPSPRALPRGESVLSKLPTTPAPTVLDLSETLKPLEGTSGALVVVDSHLCIPGASGAVVCVPFSAFQAGRLVAERVLTLQPSAWALKRLLTSLGAARPANAVRAAFALPLGGPGGKTLLGLVHEDATLRFWDVARQQQVGQEALGADSAARPPSPVAAVFCPAAGGGGAQHVLLVEYQADDPLQPHPLVAYSLTGSSGVSGRPAVLARAELAQPAGGEGRLHSAKLSNGALRP